MATMTGTSLLVTLDGDPIGHTTSFTIDFQHNTADASSRDSAGWTELITSTRNATISFEGLVDYADDTAADKKGFHDLVSEGILNRGTFSLVYGTAVSGDKIFTVDALLTNVSATAPNEDTVTFSGTFASTGAVVESTNA